MIRAIVTVGLGFGDESKGATTDFLCKALDADLVVRYNGGAQAGHNVVTIDGKHHTFSQFGSGTLSGIPTYIGPAVIIAPQYMTAEADHLVSLGVSNPLGLLRIDRRCLISTPWQVALNRIRELARSKKHGSCGLGIGVTREYDLIAGAGLRVADLADFKCAVSSMQKIIEWVRKEIEKIHFGVKNVCDLAGGVSHLEVAYSLLDSDPEIVFEYYNKVLAGTSIVDQTPKYQTAVFEGAQGVLLDEWCGFHPYTTWSATTLKHANELLTANPPDERCNIGVLRSYCSRHGVGPMPTEDVGFLITDEHNPTSQWQDNIRFGPLDLPLLRYAKQHLQGPLDCVALSHLDQIVRGPVCVKYQHNGCAIDTIPAPIYGNINTMVANTGLLMDAKPVFEEASIIDRVSDLAPIAVTSYGETSLDRDIFQIPWRDVCGR